LTPFYDMMKEIETALDDNFPYGTNPMFDGSTSGNSVKDDHSPFLAEGLERIFYIITRPFPSVWHTTNDDMDALDMNYIRRLAQLLRVWTAQYFKYPSSQ